MSDVVFVDSPRFIATEVAKGSALTSIATHFVAAEVPKSSVLSRDSQSQLLAAGQPGPPGDGDLHYRHVQGVAASTWIVVHNLGKYPTVAIVDSGGSVVVGEIRYDSTSQCTLTFAFAFSGEAYAN